MWRRANLHFGGLRFSKGGKRLAGSSSFKAASLFLIGILCVPNVAESAMTLGDIANLSSADVANFIFGGNFVDAPSGSEIIEQLGVEHHQLGKSSTITDLLIQLHNTMPLNPFPSEPKFDVATGSSSLVGLKLV